MNQKMISNKVFFENIKSLIKLSKDSLKLISTQSSEFSSKLIEGDINADWMDEHSHYSNADWILLNSIYISIFSHFEFRLFRLCKLLEEKSVSPMKINHLTGSGITKFYNYLNLVANIESADKSSNFFSEIQKFQKTRNLITHNGGIILTDKNNKITKTDTYKFLKEHNVRIGGSMGFIRITNIGFIEYFAELICKVISQITEDINKKIQE